jgi:predicted XRE-type DNA-binding protein
MEQEFEKSSGNVFSDLGFPDSEQELVKAKLTVQIYRLIKKQGLSQIEAAKLLGTTQPQISALMRCRPTSISIGRLMDFLTILGQDIEVNVKPAQKRRGKKSRGHMSVALMGVYCRIEK